MMAAGQGSGLRVAYNEGVKQEPLDTRLSVGSYHDTTFMNGTRLKPGISLQAIS